LQQVETQPAVNVASAGLAAASTPARASRRDTAAAPAEASAEPLVQVQTKQF
jgi:hypothetical protein